MIPTASQTFESLCLSGLAYPWTNPAAATPETEASGYRLCPGDAEQVAELLAWLKVHSFQVALSPQEATLLQPAVWIDLSQLKNIRQYQLDDFVITVETGLCWGELDTIVTAHGQQLPLSYPPDTRLVDLLAADLPALETGIAGQLRDYVLKTEIATVDGQLTISGADVVKNVTGYDLHRFYTGCRHALGIITAVTLKLTPRPKARQAWQIETLSLSQADVFSRWLLNSPLSVRWCEWIAYPVAALPPPATQPGSPHERFNLARLPAETSIPTNNTAPATNEDLRGTLLFELAGNSEENGTENPHWASTDKNASTPLYPEPEGSPTPQRLIASEALHWLETEIHWPETALVAEIATPLSAWPMLVQTLCREMRQSTNILSAHWRIQVRPAAGLVYLVFPSDSPIPSAHSFNVFEMLKQCQSIAQRHGGFLQIMQCAPLWLLEPENQPPDAPPDTFDRRQQQARLRLKIQPFNLPDDDNVRRLLNAFKKSYDPEGTLFSLLMPLA